MGTAPDTRSSGTPPSDAPVAAPVRLGRPPKLDEFGTSTRERLLAAAVASCAQQGFEGTTVADIARRADVSAPAIYNHFGGKVQLLVEAGRFALDRLNAEAGRQATAGAIARAFLADEFAETRRLLSELHLAGQRHPDVADLLAKWHGDHAVRWRRRSSGPDSDATVKTFFALLLGLCQIDSMSSLEAPTPTVVSRVDALLNVLFPDEEDIR